MANLISHSQRSQLRELVEVEIASLSKQIELSKLSGKTVALDQTLAGRVSRIDAIQQQKMAKSATARDQKRKLRLESVLEHLDETYYGVCEECDNLIGFERLKIKPESRFCITCQSLLE
jgi:DnaK suppressor protein